jgi:hypothetical protein
MSVSPSTQTELEAYAFRQLVAHLQSRPDVQNIDQMNLAGFCRNCLSKWYLRGARERGLRMNYDEALEVVYGEPYADWKKKHQSKASPEQMALFESNAHLHAQHPKMEDFPPSPAPEEREKRETRPAPPAKGAASDVCCTPADEIGVVEHSVADATPSSDRTVPRSGASKENLPSPGGLDCERPRARRRVRRPERPRRYRNGGDALPGPSFQHSALRRARRRGPESPRA